MPSTSPGRVDSKKIDFSAIYPWIVEKVYDFMGHEDKVVIEYIFNTIKCDRYPSSSAMKKTLERFVSAEKSRTFVNELWDLLKSAEQNKEGFPLKLVTNQIAAIREKNKNNQGKSLEYGYDEFDGYGLPRKNDRNPYLALDVASDPVPREHNKWQIQHRTYLERARVLKSDDIVFFGDSVIRGFERFGSVCSKHFPDQSLNVFGIARDRTQNLLYRATHGEISRHISLVVIHCGRDNIIRDSPESIVNALKAIVFEIQTANSPCSVLVLGLIPSDSDRNSKMNRTSLVNSGLKEAFDNKKIFNVWFLDGSKDWIHENNRLDSRFYHTDFYHLSEAGYEKLSCVLSKKIKAILEEKKSLSYKRLLNQELLRIEKEKSSHCSRSYSSRSRSDSRSSTSNHSDKSSISRSVSRSSSKSRSESSDGRHSSCCISSCSCSSVTRDGSSRSSSRRSGTSSNRESKNQCSRSKSHSYSSSREPISDVRLKETKYQQTKINSLSSPTRPGVSDQEDRLNQCLMENEGDKLSINSSHSDMSENREVSVIQSEQIAISEDKKIKQTAIPFETNDKYITSPNVTSNYGVKMMEKNIHTERVDHAEHQNFAQSQKSLLRKIYMCEKRFSLKVDVMLQNLSNISKRMDHLEESQDYYFKSLLNRIKRLHLLKTCNLPHDPQKHIQTCNNKRNLELGQFQKQKKTSYGIKQYTDDRNILERKSLRKYIPDSKGLLSLVHLGKRHSDETPLSDCETFPFDQHSHFQHHKESRRSRLLKPLLKDQNRHKESLFLDSSTHTLQQRSHDMRNCKYIFKKSKKQFKKEASSVDSSSATDEEVSDAEYLMKSNDELRSCIYQPTYIRKHGKRYGIKKIKKYA